MKKVLFVLYSLCIGGAEKSLVNLLNELPPDKYEVDLLLFRRTGEFLSQVPEWVNVLETPEAMKRLYGPMKKAGKYLLAKGGGILAARMMRRTRKSQYAWRWKHVFVKRIPSLQKHYDVAVAYAGSENMYMIADHVSADRRIVFIHTDYRTAKYSAEDDDAYFAQMDEIVSISQKCVDVLAEVFPQHKHKLHYLENITSSALVKARADAYEPTELAQDGACIMSVGRLAAPKGFEMAIDAAAILKERGLDFHWYIVGGGELHGALQAQIEERGLQEQFVLLGARDNPYPYMKHCNVLVQSSRYEGKSVVLDEAKMLRKPIVATAYPTVRDQVLEGCEGIVTAMNPTAIADGVQRMLTDDALRASVEKYLGEHEYGNQSEVEKYMQLLDM